MPLWCDLTSTCIFKNGIKHFKQTQKKKKNWLPVQMISSKQEGESTDFLLTNL